MEKGAVGLVLRVAFHKLLKGFQRLRNRLHTELCARERCLFAC